MAGYLPDRPHRRVLSLWKIIWQFLKKFNVHLPYNPLISLLGVYPRQMKACMHAYKDLYVNIPSTFICNSQNQTQHKCPSTGEYINCGISVQWNTNWQRKGTNY